MKVRFFLFLFLLTTICRGQLPFDYKKDSLATLFDVKKFKKYNEDGEYEFYKEDSTAILQFIDEKGYIEWIFPKKSNIKTCNFFTKKGEIYRKVHYFQDFPIGKEYLFKKGKVYKQIDHDKDYKISIEDLQRIILQTFEVDIYFSKRDTPYYMEITRGSAEVYPKDWRYIYTIRFNILAEEELVHRIYYIDASSGNFLYKDEYGTQEDFFGRAKDLPKENITVPLRHYSQFEPL